MPPAAAVPRTTAAAALGVRRLPLLRSGMRRRLSLSAGSAARCGGPLAAAIPGATQALRRLASDCRPGLWTPARPVLHVWVMHRGPGSTTLSPIASETGSVGAVAVREAVCDVGAIAVRPAPPEVGTVTAIASG